MREHWAQIFQCCYGVWEPFRPCDVKLPDASCYGHCNRLKWIEADKEASDAKRIADGLQWLVAVRVARDAAEELHARAGDSVLSTADLKEGRAERRRRGPLSFVTGAMIAPQVMVALGAAAVLCQLRFM